MLFKSNEHFHLLTTDRWTDGRTDSRITRGYLRNIGFMIEKSSILRKTIEEYLDSVPSLTFNTIKTKPIMHAFYSSRGQNGAALYTEKLQHFHLLTTDRWTDGRTDSRITRGYLRNIGFMIEKSSILRKTIEEYLDSVPSLTFNTIKTKPIMHAFYSSRGQNGAALYTEKSQTFKND